MKNSWRALKGVEQLFFLMDADNSRLYEIVDLVDEYCEEVGCDRCCFDEQGGCQIPEFLTYAEEKEYLWLLKEANVDWELYKISPNSVPSIHRVIGG